MKVSWKWLGIATLGLFSSTTFAVPPDSANGYQKIPERNMFGLKEPPPAVQPTNVEPQTALPKIFLTGITTLGGFKRALFSIQSPAKTGQPAKEEYLMLTEGQRENGIEVLSVDEIAKEVKVNNSGTIMSLNFEKNGVKTAAPSPVQNQPNQPGASTPGVATVIPSANPSTGAMMPPQTGYRRTLRLPNSVPTPPVPTVPVSPPPSSAALGVPGATAQRQAAGTSTPVTPEEELLLRALQEKGVAPQ
jgi:hypothetical protein